MAGLSSQSSNPRLGNASRQSAPQQPSAAGQLHMSVPVVQPPSPYWVDPTSHAVAPAQHYHYFAVAPPAAGAPAAHPSPAATATSQPLNSSAGPTGVMGSPSSHPRPRKPYTTTKVREMWSASEHERMLEGLRLYKRDWAEVTRFVGTRSAAQVRSHAQKYFDRVARDKTDDYVPRARPKRKSATPYPRKAREDSVPGHAIPQSPALQQPHAVSSSPVPAPMSVPVQHVSHPHSHSHPPAHSRHPMAHSPHAGAVQVQLSARPSIMPQVATSPAFMQQQHILSMPQGVPTHMFSPYMTLCPPPQAPSQDASSPAVQSSPIPRPSPMSFLSGHTYPFNSPAPHQPQMQMPPQGQAMYSVFSPMTPGTYPPMAQSPALGHSPIAYVTPSHMPPQQHHVPTHSHPGGSSDNCAKCAALQRYGNVLQEIGDFRHSAVPPSAHGGLHASRDAANGHAGVSQPPPLRPSNARQPEYPRSEAKSGASRKHGEGDPNARTDSSGCRPGRKLTDESSCISNGDARERSGLDGSAQRAYRAKVMRARKAKGKSVNRHVVRASGLGESGGESESFNSAAQIGSSAESVKNSNRREKAQDSTGGSQVTKKTLTTAQVSNLGERGVKRKLDSTDASKRESNRNPKKRMRSRGMDCERPARHARGASADGTSGKKAPSEEISVPPGTGSVPRASECSSPATRICYDKSEDGSRRKRPSSPDVQTYSPSERKEIFDAVKSLQILAKTSSSSSSST